MHDRVRRRICVAGFFMLCVLSTLLVLAWAAAWSSPWHVRAEARRIGRQLGMEIGLGRVEHLRPGAVRLVDVVLRDCEERDAMLSCGQLDAELKNVTDHSGASRRVLTLRTEAAEIDGQRLPALGKLVRRLLELQAGNTNVEVRLSAESIEIRSGQRAKRLAPAWGAVQTFEGRTEAWLDFYVDGQTTRLPAGVLLGRNRQVQPYGDWFELKTRETALPCWLLGWGIPAMRSRGETARFRGYLHAESAGNGWDGGIGSTAAEQGPGEFLDVDLDRLITDRFPHALGGKARVMVHAASFRGNRLEQIEGSVSAGPGMLSSSLLKAAAEHLGLKQAATPAAQDDLVPYDWLAFRFRLDGSGLAISESRADAVILAHGARALLEATGRECPAVGLVRAMVPGDSIQVPATQQSELLLRHLVLPEVVPASAVHGHSRLATHGKQQE